MHIERGLAETEYGYIHYRSSGSEHAPLQTNLRPSDASGFSATRTLDFVREHDAMHAPVNADQSWMDRINIAQIEAGRDRWQPLQALGAYDLPASLRRIACPALFMMGEHFHYTKDLGALQALVQNAGAEVVPDARFCVTWSHAAHIARRTFELMGVTGR